MRPSASPRRTRRTRAAAAAAAAAQAARAAAWARCGTSPWTRTATRSTFAAAPAQHVGSGRVREGGSRRGVWRSGGRVHARRPEGERGTVALTKSVCRTGAPAAVDCGTRSCVESKPCSRARVASVETHSSTSSTTSMRSPPILSSPARSTDSACCTLATMTCGGSATSHLRWRLAPEPSIKAMTSSRSGLPAASCRAARATCVASSRVGSSTRACTEEVGLRFARIGSR